MKMYSSFFFIVWIVLITSCQHKQTPHNTTLDYKAASVKILTRAADSLLTKAPILDNDLSSYYHYHYADSILNIIKTREYIDLDISMARLYNVFTHIFYAMSYTRTIYFHAEYPLSNQMFMRIDNIDKSDSVLKSYQEENNPLDIIELKDAWMRSMIFFFEVNQDPTYKTMKSEFDSYLLSKDSILTAYPQEDAFIILNLNSEKALAVQIIILTVDIIQSKEGVAGVQAFSERGQEICYYYDSMPVKYDEILALDENKYYEFFFYSQAIIYENIIKVCKRVKD